MRYRFKCLFRHFRAGDLVPETYDKGVIATMLQAKRIELVDIDQAEALKVAAPAENKAMKTAKLRKKAMV